MAYTKNPTWQDYDGTDAVLATAATSWALLTIARALTAATKETP